MYPAPFCEKMVVKQLSCELVGLSFCFPAAVSARACMATHVHAHTHTLTHTHTSQHEMSGHIAARTAQVTWQHNSVYIYISAWYKLQIHNK